MNLIKLWAVLAALFFGLITRAEAQPRMRAESFGAEVFGEIVSEDGAHPIEYATIMLVRTGDSTKVGGAVSDENGRFRIESIRPGNYLAQISFIGFLPQTLDQIELRRGERELDLGTIELEATAIQMEEVAVEGEATSIEYHLDKKVINVSRQTTAVSGTAIDVLENAPSVSVDIEGNLSLRGSGNFTVLIDGRPSILEGSEALQQIPAGTIESIEIMTNPSAKYDPGSTAGIINVVLTHQRQSGYSGLVNVSGGTQDNRGVDVLLTRKLDGVTLLLGGSYDERNFNGSQRQETRTTYEGVTSNVITDGQNDRGYDGWGLRAELDWQPNVRNAAKIGGRFGDRTFGGESSELHEEWSSTSSGHASYRSASYRERTGNRLSLYTTLRHDFEPRKNYLSLNAQYSRREGDEITRTELYSADDGTIAEGTRSAEDGPGERANVELDYLLEFSENSKLEAGAHTQSSDAEDRASRFVYDPASEMYIEEAQYGNATDYRRDIHAVYSTYSNALGEFHYQLGLRGEYTYRKISVLDTNQEFSIDRWDYFPTSHLSYDLGGGRQAMASYARRIERPRGWHLEPFRTWENAYNVREGNPALKPEYIDSYEAGYQTPLLGMTATLEGYYRVTNNRIERIQSVYAENVTLRSVRNVGKDFSLGSEYRLSAAPIKKIWELDLSGNLYDYRVEGNLDGRSFDEHSFTWDARISNTLNLTPSWRLQLDASYRGPSVTSQGQREGFFMANAGIRKQFWDKQLTATLQARDLFSTGQHEFTASGPDFYEYHLFDRDAPMIMLNLSFNFNNFKQKRENGDSNDIGEDDEL